MTRSFHEVWQHERKYYFSNIDSSIYTSIYYKSTTPFSRQQKFLTFEFDKHDRYEIFTHMGFHIKHQLPYFFEQYSNIKKIVKIATESPSMTEIRQLRKQIHCQLISITIALSHSSLNNLDFGKSNTNRFIIAIKTTRLNPLSALLHKSFGKV